MQTENLTSVLIFFRKHTYIRLPTASTCFNLLKLPNYQKKATLKVYWMEKHPQNSCELLWSHLGEAALCYHLQHWVWALLSDLWWGATLRGAILVYTKGVANLKTCRHHWPRAFNRGKEWFHTLAETVTYNIFVTKILVTNVPKSEQSLTIFPWQSQSKLMCWISVKLCLWYKSDHY